MTDSDSPLQVSRRSTAWLVAIIAVLVLCIIALLMPRYRTSIVTVDNAHRWSDTSALSRREVAWQPAVPLAPEIQSESNSHFRPQLSVDGSILYFTIRTPANDYDIYRARRSNHGWLEPEKVSELNSEADDVGPVIRDDGKVLYLYSNRDGGFGGMDLYVSVRNEGGWTKPANMGASINSAAHEYDPAIAPDGRCFFFSSNRSDQTVDSKFDRWSTTLRSDPGNRTFDLYVAWLDESSEQWSPATSLDRVNTDQNEGAPFVSPDGAFLYFASDRPTQRRESKNFDIYRVAIERPQLPPENLGASVNTAADETEPALASAGFRLQFSRSDESETASYSLFESTAKEIYRDGRWEYAYGGLAGVAWRILDRTWLILLVLAALAALVWMIRQVAVRGVAVPGFLILALLLHLMLVSGSFFVFFENAFTRKLKDMFLEQTVVASEVLLSSTVPKNAERPDYESVAAIEIPASVQPADVSRKVVEISSEFTPIEFAKPQRITNNSLSPTKLPTEPVVATVPVKHESVAIPDLLPRAAVQADVPRDEVPLERTVAIDLPETANVERLSADLARRVLAGEQQVDPIELEMLQSKLIPPVLDSSNLARPAITPPVEWTGVTVKLERAGSPSITDTQYADTPVPTEQVTSVESEQITPPKTQNIELDRESIMAPAIEQPEPLKLAMRSNGAFKAQTNVELVPLVTEHDSDGSPASEPPSSPLKRTSSLKPTLAADTMVAAESIDRIPEVPATPETGETPNVDIGREVTTPASIDVRALAMNFEPANVRALHSDALEPITMLARSARPPERLGGGPLSRSMNRSRGYADARVKLQNLLLRRKLDEATKAEVVKEFGGNDATLLAIRRGLSWIEQHQELDGHWSLHQFGKRCEDHKRCNGHGKSRSDTAGTGLALLPFLGDGNTHQEGPCKDAVARGITWLISNQKSDGNLFTGGEGNAFMYSHGIATIALCECYGMTKDPSLREPCQRAIDFIIAAQDPKSGGWRYRPREQGDTSVVGWQVMALKSAQMAELAVPEKVLAEARRWLESVAGQNGRLGQFGYQRNNKFNPAMTAEAMLCLEYMDDRRDSESLVHAAEFLLKNLPKKGRETSYYWYYGTQAMFHLQGDHWKKWNEAIHPLLIDTQLKDGPLAGTWDPRDQWERGGGRIYSTSLRVLMLEIYYRHLPIYQAIE